MLLDHISPKRYLLSYPATWNPLMLPLSDTMSLYTYSKITPGRIVRGHKWKYWKFFLKHFELGIPASVVCDYPTLQKAVWTTKINCRLKCILFELVTDRSLQFRWAACSSHCSCQVLQIICTPAILLKPIETLCVSYGGWKTAGSESVSWWYIFINCIFCSGRTSGNSCRS